MEAPAAPAATLAAVRAILLATLLAGIAGTTAELLLLGHFEDWRQQAPLVLLAFGLLAVLWHAVRPAGAIIRIVRTVMVLFIASGLAGVYFHYRGNVEFELEMYPSLSGLGLMKQTVTGATPVLAPGAMVLLGMIGLAHAHCHPASGASSTPRLEQS